MLKNFMSPHLPSKDVLKLSKMPKITLSKIWKSIRSKVQTLQDFQKFAFLFSSENSTIDSMSLINSLERNKVELYDQITKEILVYLNSTPVSKSTENSEINRIVGEFCFKSELTLKEASNFYRNVLTGFPKGLDIGSTVQEMGSERSKERFEMLKEALSSKLRFEENSFTNFRKEISLEERKIINV